MKSCLVVDDSSVVRKVARRILEDLDYIVDEAEDGQEAFDKCRQEMPDAILLDWQMPVMSGLEFLKLLRGYVGGHTPRVVYMVTENDIGQIALATALDWIAFRKLPDFEAGRPLLSAWYQSFIERPSMQATAYSGQTQD